MRHLCCPRKHATAESSSEDRRVGEMQSSGDSVEITPTIDALEEQLERIRQSELERLRRRQVSFCSDQEDAIEELTLGIVSAILHGPVSVLEAASIDGERGALLGMLHRIFNLGRETGNPHTPNRHEHRAI